jgi:hypothetical protein
MSSMWTVTLHPELEKELDALPAEVAVEIAAGIGLLRQLGPYLARPRAGTLRGSRHANMKELRFQVAGGVWRLAFAFDPARRAVMLVAGDKSGVNERRFYRTLIARADRRFDEHLGRKDEA